MTEMLIKAFQDQFNTAANAFSSSAFSPNAFSSNAFSPNAFSPNAFSSMEVPPAFRDLAEKSVEGCRGNFEKMKAAAEQTTNMIEGSYATASKGVAEINLKSLEILRANVNSAFDFMANVLAARSAAEAVELSTSHLRTQMETMSEQAKELSGLAQKFAVESAEPIKGGVEKTFRSAA